MIERNADNIYDLIKLTHGTKKELEDNKDILTPYEPSFSNDTNELFIKDEQGNLISINNTEDIIELENRVTKNESDILLKALEFGNDLYGENINLDDYVPMEDKKYIVHRIGSSNTAINGINFPSNKGGLLEVIRSYSTDVIQKYHDFNDREFKRKRGADAVWSSWMEMFDTSNCPISKSDNGWCKLANGLIIQWGRGEIIKGKYNTIFPVAFSAIPKITYNIIHPSEENIIIDAKVASCTVSGATFTSNYTRSDLNIKSTNENEFFWTAIGY